jgi:hypothetical protein
METEDFERYGMNVAKFECKGNQELGRVFVKSYASCEVLMCPAECCTDAMNLVTSK